MPSSTRRSRPGPALLAAASLIVLLAALGAVGLALTPREHVAAGCFWWTATTVGEVIPGARGCLRGTVVRGGSLAEGGDPGDPRLPIAYADPDRGDGRAPCPFHPGDAVAVRYHAVFDDGRTIVVVEDCR